MDKIPSHMTVMAITTPGGPEVLVPQQREVPKPGAGDILVKVAAAGINRPDVLQRMGKYVVPPGASDLPGLEIAGAVAALGEGVTKYKIGDKVMSLTSGGGYAEYCVVPDSHAMRIPDGLSLTDAAALPETVMTVWSNVFERGALKPDDTLLVHGGSSGIGTTAIQMGKAFGAKVIVTVGSKDKADACLKLGADVAVDYKTQDFVAECKTATNGKGVNVILDMVGGDYVDRNYDAAATEARIVQIAFLGGPKTTVNVAKIMTKRLWHTGSFLRPRSREDKAAMVNAIEAKVLPWIATGRVKPLIDSTFSLKDAAKAHARMESGEHIGKIVLTV